MNVLAYERASERERERAPSTGTNKPFNDMDGERERGGRRQRDVVWPRRRSTTAVAPKVRKCGIIRTSGGTE